MDDKVCSEACIVFVEVRSRYLHNIMILSSSVSCVREHNFSEKFAVDNQEDYFEFGRNLTAEAYSENYCRHCSLWSALIHTGCALTTIHGGILSRYLLIFFCLHWTCHVIHPITGWRWYTVTGELITRGGNGKGQPFTLANTKLRISLNNSISIAEEKPTLKKQQTQSRIVTISTFRIKYTRIALKK